ncbi:MAG: DNA gyrase inhibitor YacG [Deltaproteobacteria bacterium]|nr:DNA gyrase inhibitor YacG [Deltaproteobacteria bacterium]
MKSLKTVKCPRCGCLTTYTSTNQSRPFCSERCKNDDIVNWATESYGIPGSTKDELQDAILWTADETIDDI